ncbi:MAG: response regulator, partial [Dongiaceae bacterium]
GIDLARQLKEEFPYILVLQTSATFITGADRIAGLDSGADAYLTQPVEPDELVAAVRALLRMRAAEEGLRQANELLERRVDERTRELGIRTTQLEERTRELEDLNGRLRHESEERSKVEAALRQSQKMEALGQLTGGIAHDFNNLLGAITSSLQLMQRRLKAGRYDVTHYIDTALSGAERAAKLTSRLLTFSRQQALSLAPLDVNELAASLTDLLRRTMGEQIRVAFDLQAKPSYVQCDENQLENALLNLAINSRDAMPAGGDFRIETRNETIATNITLDFGELQAGEYVTLSVIDTGTGMTPAVKERAMEPFFTTKPIGQGTGLGLSMIYGLMSQCGGALTLESDVGKGTCVKLYLARNDRPRQSGHEPSDESGQQPRMPATVLIAEDEELIRMMMVEILQDEQYRVLEASDGESALAHIQRGEKITLLITDIGLPGTNGRQLVEAARRIIPDLKLLFVTGYSRDILQRRMVENGEDDTDWISEVPILRKPFDLTSFTEKVNAILRES